MSTKQSKAAIQKRQKRDQRSKAKRKSANRADASIRNQLKGLIGNKDLLEKAVRDAKLGRGQKDVRFNNADEVIAGLKEAVNEVFKLYSYLTIAYALIEKGAITHTLSVDLNKVSIDMLNMDSRISRLSVMEEDVVAVESLEIGQELHDKADALYNEVASLEPHALVIDETVEALVAEVEGDEATNIKRARVLHAVAYQFMHRAKVAHDAALEQESSVETANEAEVV